MKKRAMFGFLFVSLFVFLRVSPCGAQNSEAWQERLKARTAVLWIDGQDLGDLVLNARAELDVTWLERALVHPLQGDRSADEWLASSLAYYFSSRKETREIMKGHDILVLNYKALKNWNFDPSKLVVNGRPLETTDILTRKDYRQTGELPPGTEGTLTVRVPSVKPGERLELRYEDAGATIETPGK
jgi:hypothetical protein